MFVPSEVSDDQRLNYLVGLACRMDAWVEMTGRTVFRELHRATAEEFGALPKPNKLFRQSLEILTDSGFDEEVVEAGAQALRDAIVAHDERVRLVHDALLEQDDEADRWVRLKDPLADRPLPASGPSTELEFEACIAALHRAQHQLTSLVFAIPATEFLHEDIVQMLPTNLAIARGDFDLADDGTVIPKLRV